MAALPEKGELKSVLAVECRGRSRRATGVLSVVVAMLFLGSTAGAATLTGPVPADPVSGESVSFKIEVPEYPFPNDMLTFELWRAGDLTPVVTVDGPAGNPPALSRIFTTTGERAVYGLVRGASFDATTDQKKFTVWPALTGGIADAAPVTAGVLVTLTATAAGGKPPLTIVWDLDNDGLFDDGTGPSVPWTFSAAGSQKVRAQISDGASPAHQLVLERTLNVGSACTKKATAGVIRLTTEGCLTKIGNTWSTGSPARVNGLLLTPATNQKLILTNENESTEYPGGRLQLAGGELAIGDMRVGIGPTLSLKNIDWTLPVPMPPEVSGEVGGFALPDRLLIKSLPITGKVTLKLGRAADGVHGGSLALNLGLPTVFLPKPAGAEKELSRVAAEATVKFNERDGVQLGGLTFTADTVYIGTLKLRNLCFAYQAKNTDAVGCNPPNLGGAPAIECAIEPPDGDRWFVGATVVLPFKNELDVGGFAGWKTESEAWTLTRFGGFVDAPFGIPVTTDVYINRLGFGLCLGPPVAVKGQVGLGLVKSPTGTLVNVLGSFQYTGPSPDDDQGWSIKVDGKADILRQIPIGELSLLYRPTAIDLSARLNLDHSMYSVSGTARGWLSLQGGALPPRFLIEGGLAGCILGRAFCAGIDGLLSDVGFAACAKIEIPYSFEVVKSANQEVDWLRLSAEEFFARLFNPNYVRYEIKILKKEVKFGVSQKWGQAVQVGCDFTPFRPAVAATSAPATATRTLAVSPGTPAVALQVQGVGTAPKLRISGPGGTRIVSPADRTSAKRRGQWMIAENAADASTLVMLIGPRAGRWKIAPLGGSAIRRIDRSILRQPVSAVGDVVARGTQRAVRLSFLPSPGARLTLVERGRGVQRTIASNIRGRRCPKQSALTGPRVLRCAAFRLRPTDGPGGTRRLQVVVMRDGLPVSTKVIATYRAAGWRKPTRPTRVGIKRRGSAVTVSWTRAPGAYRYGLTVDFSDGRQVLLEPRASCRGVTIRDVGATVAVRAGVYSIRRDREVSRSRTTSLPAGSKSSRRPPLTKAICPAT